jgi:hypothetical protein
MVLEPMFTPATIESGGKLHSKSVDGHVGPVRWETRTTRLIPGQTPELPEHQTEQWSAIYQHVYDNRGSDVEWTIRSESEI